MTFTKANLAGWGATDQVTPKQLNHLQNNISKGIDGVGGGRYNPAADLSITSFGDLDVHGQMLMFLGVAGGGPRVSPLYGTIADVNNSDFGIATGGQILRFANTGGVRDHDMDNTGAQEGDWIIFYLNLGGGALFIHKDGSGYAGAHIVRMVTQTSALLFFDGTDWRLGHYSTGATAGADA